MKKSAGRKFRSVGLSKAAIRWLLPQQIWMAKTDRAISILEMTQISQDFFGQLEWRHFVNIEYAKPLISKKGMSNLIAIIEPADGLAPMGDWTLKCYVLEEYYTLIFDDVNFDLY